MIIDISDSKFKGLMNDKNLFLPIRWKGENFHLTLKKLFDYYIKKIESVTIEGCNSQHMKADIERIKSICGLLLEAVAQYLNGFPSGAYIHFGEAMRRLNITPLQIYRKNDVEQFGSDVTRDGLELYRVVGVDDNKPGSRRRVFHTPYNMRSKVSTCRYSIAGYPSLYLGTCLALCCEEIHIVPGKDLALASKFKLERVREYTNTNIQVIELGIKPQDFLNTESLDENRGRRVPRRLLSDRKVKEAYLLWYPLIAACSFIRVSKKDPFAAEYILPQLLMQWVRSEMSVCGAQYNQLVGIRYFSCASMRASEMGFNYVFPTSGEEVFSKMPYCAVLSKTFRLTEPEFLHEHSNLDECEDHLRELRDYDFVTTS